MFGIFIALLGAFTPIVALASLANMAALTAYVFVSIAVPLLRRRESGKEGFNLPFGPYLLPVIFAISSLGLMFSLKWVASLVFGIPSPWLGFIIWICLGILIYMFYGRARRRYAAA